MLKTIAIPTGELQEAIFVHRPNRFLVHCILQDTKTLVEAHLPDPGRLKELLQQGRRIWLRPSNNPNRKTHYSAVLVEEPQLGGLVSIDSSLPNHLMKRALKEEALEELIGWSYLRSEFKEGSSRFDFLLEDINRRKMLLEVKSVTLVREGQGLFPDAITARGAKHVKELTHLKKEGAFEAGIFFVIQRGDACTIKAEEEIDPDFSMALAGAKRAGVMVFGRRCTISLEKVTLGERVPVLGLD